MRANSEFLAVRSWCRLLDFMSKMPFEGCLLDLYAATKG